MTATTVTMRKIRGSSKDSTLHRSPEPGGEEPEIGGIGKLYRERAGGLRHSAGPRTEFAMGGNPFFGQPEKVNPATYLGGGRDFGELVPPPGIGSAHIISRNLTPTPKTGLPEGDHTFEEFLTILRTGKDFDHLHPTCTGAPNPGCVPKPFDGDLLQIMPWPIQQHMTDHEIRAIYEYLKAIPCIQGNYPGEPADRCKKE